MQIARATPTPSTRRTGCISSSSAFSVRPPLHLFSRQRRYRYPPEMMPCGLCGHPVSLANTYTFPDYGVWQSEGRKPLQRLSMGLFFQLIGQIHVTLVPSTSVGFVNLISTVIMVRSVGRTKSSFLASSINQTVFWRPSGQFTPSNVRQALPDAPILVVHSPSRRHLRAV